jgi:hypothetical protein
MRQQNKIEKREKNMNTILQKRIEEAATFLFKQRGLDKESCRQAMYYILANQWISVEKALPKDFEKVFFRAVGKNDSVCYGTGYVAKEDWYTDIQCVEQDYFKFKITHWAPIPSLEGGEE